MRACCRRQGGVCLALALLMPAGPALAQQGGLVTNPFASNHPSAPLRTGPPKSLPTPRDARDGLILPAGVAPEHAGLPAGAARRQTCLDQYRANQAAGTGNAGLRWTTKGGGYYAACNRRLAG